MEHESLLRIRIRARRKAQQRQLLMIVFISMLLGVWLWYSFVYTHTPDFAAKEIRNAIEQHDADKFKQYMNLDLIVSNAYDDLTIDLFHYRAEQSPSIKRFYTLIRPQLIKGTTELILRRISSGEWTMPTGSEIMKGNQLGIDYEWFIEYSQLRNTEIKDINNIIRTGTTASAEAVVINRYTQTPFIIKLTMEQTETGRWQITSLNNYRAYLTETIPRLQHDTLNYLLKTRPISRSYNDKFTAQRTTFQAIMKTARGSFNPQEKATVKNLIQQQIIPTLTARQAELDSVPVPAGAAYLKELRAQSTSATIKAWEYFLAGILTDDKAKFGIAEVYHKQEMEIDRRIENLIELVDQ